MKKLIAMMLALVMVLSLCACNKKDDGAAEEETETAYLLTEIVMTTTDEDGKAHTMKANPEYDDDYNIVGLKSYEDDKLATETTYDRDFDKPLVWLEYDEDGKVTDRTEYTYDDKGNCLESNSSYTDEDGKTSTYKEVCTYDGDGNQLTRKYYSNGELYSENTYTYTATGKVATETYIYSRGYESHYSYTYDEHDNLLKVEASSYVETYENVYENGKLVEAKGYEDGELESYAKYDANGNVILKIYYDDGAEEDRYEYTYDENGKILKRVSKWGDGTDTVTYTYNSNGKITEYNYSNSDGDSNRMTYSYDDNGNIVGVKLYEDGKVCNEFTLTYKEVEVPEETAEKIEAIVEKLGKATDLLPA